MINLVCYNLKITNIFIYTFNQNLETNIRLFTSFNRLYTSINNGNTEDKLLIPTIDDPKGVQYEKQQCFFF